MSTAQRPTHAGLSRERILAIALEMVDSDGPEKLTMRRLGARLGVDPMAVYYYIPNKTALFDGITEVIWSGLNPGSIDPAAPWQSQLCAAMLLLRDTLRAHPRAITILGTRPAVSPELLGTLDRMITPLVKAGMPANADTADLINVLVTYTIGHVLAEVGEPVGGRTLPSAYESLTPESHPNLAALLNQGWRPDSDAQYTKGLHAIMKGWSPSTPC